MKKLIALTLVIMMLFAMLLICSCEDPVDSDTDTNTNGSVDSGESDVGGLDHDHSIPKDPEQNAESDSIINW